MLRTRPWGSWVGALLGLLILSACGGGTPVNTGAQDSFDGSLIVRLERLAQQQNSRVIPLLIEIEPVDAASNVPVWIRLGYKLKLSLSERIQKMSAAPGTPDFNDPNTIFQIPPDGAQFLLYWDTAADLGDLAVEDTVVIRAGAMRTNAQDPKEAICDFQPVIRINLRDPLSCAAPPPVLEEGDLTEGVLGVPYSDTIRVQEGEAPFRFEVLDPVTGLVVPNNSLGFGLTVNRDTGAISGTPTGTLPASLDFTVRLADSCGVSPSDPEDNNDNNDNNVAVWREGSQASLSRPDGRIDVRQYTIPFRQGEVPCEGGEPVAEPPTARQTITVGQEIDINFPITFPGLIGTVEQVDGTMPPGLEFSVEQDELPRTLRFRLFGTVTDPDEELPISYSPYFEATDGCPNGGLSTVFGIDFELVAECINTNPQVQLPPSFPNANVGQPYSVTFPLTFANGFGTLQSTGGSLPPGLTLTLEPGGNPPATHQLRVTGTPQPTGATEPEQFTASYTVFDGCDNELQTSFNVTITLIPAPPGCPTLSITTTGVPSGEVGQPYSFTFQATGGQGTQSWSLASGALPTGLTLNAGGVLSGTPTEAGTFPLQVRVQDQCTPTAQFDVRNFDLVIEPAPEVCDQLTLTRPITMPDATNNQPYAFTFTASGGVPPYAFAIDANPDTLPGGLNLFSNGLVSGVPNDEPGLYTFDVIVTDSCPDGAQEDRETVTLTLLDGCAEVQIITTDLPNATNGEFYSTALVGLGQGTLTWSISKESQDSLPNGLTLEPNGIISGVPSDESRGYFITFTLTDSCDPFPQSDGVVIVLILLDGVVCEDLLITTSGLPGAVNGEDYSFQFDATGVFGEAFWALDAGSGPLPAGLTLRTDGVLSGTPEDKTGTYSITVVVTDECPEGRSDIRGFDLELTNPGCPALGPVTNLPPFGVNGEPFFWLPELAEPGVPPLRWELDPKFGTGLPAGLDLEPDDGSIFGSPDAAEGLYTFRLIVTDSCTNPEPQVWSQDFSIQVFNCTPLGPITGFPAPVAINGEPYSFQPLLVNPGVPPYFWFELISKGTNFPGGLEMNTETGLISGTPNAFPGTYTVEIAVEDFCNFGDPGQQASVSFDIIVQQSPNCPDVVIQNEVLPDVTIFGSYSEELLVTGSSPDPSDYFWFVVAGQLPPGLRVEFDDKLNAWFLVGVVTDPELDGVEFTFSLRVEDYGCAEGLGFDEKQFTVTCRMGT